MCTYKDIDIIQLPNGQTASEANRAASREIERIYADSWRRGVSVPFFDNDGNTYLANPDGSEDPTAAAAPTVSFAAPPPPAKAVTLISFRDRWNVAQS